VHRFRCRMIRFAALLAVLVTFLPGRPVGAEPRGRRARDVLAKGDANYSAEHQMVGGPFNSPGYHSQVADGTWVHPTRHSLEYARWLVDRNGPGDIERAQKIIRKVLSLQDTDPDSRTYGIWPWLLEEPLEKMSPPDWNWADFLGAQLAELLVLHPDRLDEKLKQAMRESLGHAARAIRRRDVQPSYTNIAIMGGVVSAAAGEILDDPALLQYGRDRLRRTVDHTQHHGGFNEYNSPTYTVVALREAERGLGLVEDKLTREAAEWLLQSAWQTIADSFHPATRQWAGPHSRAYRDTISREAAAELAHGCPEALAVRFRALPEDPHEIRRTFIRGSTPEENTVGTTWHTADACFGTVNRSSLWTQRRPLIAYWTAGDDQVAVLRARFLHDGRDFASMGIRTAQAGPRALSLVHPLRNHGSWHMTLDRPADGVFRAADLRLRYELTAPGAVVQPLGSNRYELRAGNRRAVVHALPGHFAGNPIRWRLDREDGKVFVDAICYEGDQRPFDFSEAFPAELAAGVELLADDERAWEVSPSMETTDGGQVHAAWSVDGEELSVGWSPE